MLRPEQAKRREKKGRRTGWIIESVYDSMENSMLGNPIDDNTL